MEGKLKIDWAKEHMPLLNNIEEEFREKRLLKDTRISIALHLEAKTANLAIALSNGGAEVAITSSNPLTTQDDVADALKEFGIKVFARRGISDKEYIKNCNRVLDIKPHIIIDDGGDLVNLLHTERGDVIRNVIGACEETTTGVERDRLLEKKKLLSFPVIAVNNAKCKHLFDNRYGTGQSAWDGIIRTTNVNIAGKNVVVAGYGWVGKGIAMRAKGFGARVIVTEVDPIKAMEAYMDGFDIMRMKEAAKLGDIFVTATGNTDVIDARYFERMKDGAILANAGHFDVEVKMKDLKKIAKGFREVRKNITEYILRDGRRLYVLGEGRLVNLACADGHPIEIMDLSFAVQALSVEYLLKNSKNLKAQVYEVPEDLDKNIAEKFLSAYKIKIDRLTKEQINYLTKL